MLRQALVHAHCQLVRCGDISVEAGEGREREREEGKPGMTKRKGKKRGERWEGRGREGTERGRKCLTKV